MVGLERLPNDWIGFFIGALISFVDIIHKCQKRCANPIVPIQLGGGRGQLDWINKLGGFEPFPASEQNVQVVMVIMVQAAWHELLCITITPWWIIYLTLLNLEFLKIIKRVTDCLNVFFFFERDVLGEMKLGNVVWFFGV